VHNLIWVTLGNLAGGALFVGGAYWLANTSLRGSWPAALAERTSALPAEGD